MSMTLPSPPPLSPKDRLLLALLRLTARALPLRAFQAIGTVIGRLLAGRPKTSPTRSTRINLELCYPGREAAWYDDATRQTLIATARSFAECAKVWAMPPAYSAGLIRDVHGFSLLEEALQSDKGIILLVPHLGAFEVMNAWVNQRISTTIMYKPDDNPALNHYVLAARSRLQARLVTADERGVRALVKVLKKGGVTVALPDHIPQDNGGVYASFYGISTWTGVLVPRLLQHTGARALMMACLRRDDGRGFDIYVQPADTAIYADDMVSACTAMNHSIEQLIALAPTQYHWYYKRFKKSEGRDINYWK